MNGFLLVNTLDKLKDLASRWKEREFAIDTEFTDLEITKQDLIGISMYTDQHNIPAVFIQFNFRDTYIEKIKDPNGGRKNIEVTRIYEKTDAIDKEEALPYLMQMIDGADVITANGKVEIKALSKLGIKINIIDDVNLMNWMLDVTTPSDLKTAGRKYLGVDMKSYEDTVGMKVGNINWNLVDWYEYGKYGAKDAWVTYNLRNVFRKEIEDDEPVKSCYLNLELPLIRSVAKTELAGVSLDCNMLNEMSNRIDVDIERERENIYDLCGVEFNLNSPKQLAEVLFDRMGLPVISETKTGGRAVGEPVLQELAYQGYEVADALLEYRQLEKLKTTYIDKLPKMVGPDGRLRGGFNQSGAETGRFSSSNPNLQNIPNNKNYPVKQAFVAGRGKSLIVVDWSTIEIRIMAHESKDPVMTDVLRNFRDVHQETTDNINKQTGLSLERSDGKTTNFAVLYGMSAESLAYTLNKELKKLVKKGKISPQEYSQKEVTKKVAQAIIDGYYQSYYGFTEWGKYEVEMAKNTGWVYTLGGRRRPIRELAHRKTYSSGVRKVINCVDSETECFTRRGWKKYNELIPYEEILTYNSHLDIMEWQPLRDVAIHEVTDINMYKFTGKNHSSLTTENHRWFYRDEPKGKCWVNDTLYLTNIPEKSSYRLPLIANFKPDYGSFSSEWLELFGIFYTDGHFLNGTRLGISQSTSFRKAGNLERIKYLLNYLGCEITKERTHKVADYDECVYLEFRGEFVNWVKSKLNPNKTFVDKSWVYKLTQMEAENLLKGLLLGDGSGSKCKTKYIGTTDTFKEEFYKEVITLSGNSWGVSDHFLPSGKNQRIISVKSRKNVYVSSLKKDKIKYSGTIWCPNVENGSFLMRKDGFTCITGNTIIQGGAGDLMKLAIVKLDDMYANKGYNATTLLYIHDEFVIEVDDHQAEACLKDVIDLMQGIFPNCTVPILCEGNIFDSWDGLKSKAQPKSKKSQKRDFVKLIINKILLN